MTKKKSKAIPTDWLVPILMERAVDCEEFRHLLVRQGLQPKYGVITSIISKLSMEYPVYEPAPGVYKILTKQDLDNYENRKRKSYVGDNYGY